MDTNPSIVTNTGSLSDIRSELPSEAHGSCPSTLSEHDVRRRARSHQQYLDSLQCPSPQEIKSIAEIQTQKERVLAAKYHDDEVEQAAARTIQKTYRGHRERRQMQGLNLDPSTRWAELVRELRFRSAVAQSHDHSAINRANRASSINVKDYWDRIVNIAEHASAGDHPTLYSSDAYPQGRGKHHWWHSKKSETENSMLMDLRYFLEMIDEKHRYGANLQIYHEEWQRSDTRQNFFQWLDHGDGRLISHPYCDRAKLMRERIRYLSREERKDYLVCVDEAGLLRWDKDGELISTDADLYRDSTAGIVPHHSESPSFDSEASRSNLMESRKLNRRLAAMRDHALDKLAGIANIGDSRPDEDSDSSSISSDSSHVDPEDAVLHQGVTSDKTPRRRFHVSPATILNRLLRKSVRPGTWIYVADTIGRLYVGIKSSGAFQHASFLSGARISSAGSIGITDGQLTYLSPLSGHYRPTTQSFRRFIDGLKAQGIDLSRLRVSNAYQILLGMEYYGAARSGVKKLTGRKEKRLSSASSSMKHDQTGDGRSYRESGDEAVGGVGGQDEEDTLSATQLVERRWQEEHQSGIRRLMDDLNIRRSSD